MENQDIENTNKIKTKIFSIKTQVGKEYNAADLVNARAEKSKLDIPSILVTPELRGYLFIEGYDKDRINDMIKTVSLCLDPHNGHVIAFMHQASCYYFVLNR